MDIFLNFIIIVGIFGGIALVFGCLLVVASRFFAVKTDERAEKTAKILPGANCGACGFAGCESYAEAIVSGNALPNLCASLSQDEIDAISVIVGIEGAKAAEKLVAHVKCCGSNGCASKRSNYSGIDDCRSLARLGGDKECAYGCYGLGNCVKACAFGAIELVDGAPVVNHKLCKGCGTCAAACPKNLIDMIPVTAEYAVACSSKDKGKSVITSCEKGCIGCGICVKGCEKGAISLVDSCAVIDYSLCDSCGNCFDKCPRGSIISFNGKKKTPVVKSAPAAPAESDSKNNAPKFSFKVENSNKE